MKKRFKELNDDEIGEFINSPDSNMFIDGILYFIEQLIQGKVFFNQEKIKHFKEIAPIFFGESMVFYRNKLVQIYVSQYKEFISWVSEDYPDLYQIEKEFTQKNIFTKKDMGHPMENVKKCVLFYNESTGSELMAVIGQLGRDLLENIARTKNSMLSDSDPVNLLKSSFEFLKKKDNGIFDKLPTFIKTVENYRDKEYFSENVNQIRILNQLKTSSLEKSKLNPLEIVRNFLTGIQDTQSHIEYFCRYVHRLVHIKKHGDRKYRGEYYHHNSKKFDENKFRDMCNTEMNNFPELKNFLRRYCVTFKDLRNIRAHQVAGEVEIFPSGYISIPNIGKEKRKNIDYREKREKIINYGVFINKIKLHPQNPYEESEDVFVSLG